MSARIGMETLYIGRSLNNTFVVRNLYHVCDFGRKYSSATQHVSKKCRRAKEGQGNIRADKKEETIGKVAKNVQAKKPIERQTLRNGRLSMLDVSETSAERELLHEELVTERSPKKRDRIIKAIENLNKDEGVISTVSGIVRSGQKEKIWKEPEGIKKSSLDVVSIEDGNTFKPIKVKRVILNDSELGHTGKNEPLEELIYKQIKQTIDNADSNTINEEKNENIINNKFKIESVDPEMVLQKMFETEDADNALVPTEINIEKTKNIQTSSGKLDGVMNPMTKLKLQALEMASKDRLDQTNLGNLKDYYHGIERKKRNEEMLKCEMTLEVLIRNGQASQSNINLLIKAKSLQGRLDDALLIYDSSLTLGFTSDAETFVALIQGAAERMDAEAARMIYLKMRTLMISPTPKVYGSLIYAHVNSGDLASGFALMRKMEKEGLQPDVVIYTTLINGLIEADRNEAAWNVFYDMRSWKLIVPDEVLFTVMIKSCAKNGNVEKALNMFDDLKLTGMRPTDITYTELIHACGKDSYFFDKAFDFFNQMKAEDMPITISVYEYLLEACSTQADLSKAKDLVAEMNASGVSLNEKCCLALIKTLGAIVKKYKKNKSERDSILIQTWSVLQYLPRLRSSDLENKAQPWIVSTPILNAVMSVYINADLHQYAIDMLPQYSHFACAPDSDSYWQLLKMFYHDLKDPGRFFGLWNFIIKETSIKPSTQMCHLALDAAIDSSSTPQTIQVLQFMYRIQVFPSQRIASKLAKVGREIPELTQIVMAFVKLERDVKIDKTQIQNYSIESNLAENELNQFTRGRTSQSVSVEDAVRKEVFKRKEKEMKGQHRIPRGLFKQLKKQGGEYYAKLTDGIFTKPVDPGSGILRN